MVIQDAISNDAFEIADTISINTNTNTSTKHKSDNNTCTTKQQIQIEKSIKAITLQSSKAWALQQPAPFCASIDSTRFGQFCFMDDEVIETFCAKRV